MKGILCFGDSMTFGRGETPRFGWCGRLKEWYEKKDDYNAVYNLGIPGDTYSGLLKRLKAELSARLFFTRAKDKYFVLIAMGTNDVRYKGLPEENKPRFTDDEFKSYVKETILILKNYNCKFAFVGLPRVDERKTIPWEGWSYTNKRVKLFNDYIKNICESEGVYFLDMFDQITEEMILDGVHPKSQGYDLMFNKIKEFIEENKII